MLLQLHAFMVTAWYLPLPASCPRLVLDGRMARLPHLENEYNHLTEQDEVIVYPGLLKLGSPNRNYSRHIQKLIVCHWTRDIKV